MSAGKRIVYNANGVDFAIYQTSKLTKSGPKQYWVLADYSTGKRRLLNNKTLKAARQRAQKIRAAMTKGRADRLLLSPGEWQDVCLALEVVKSIRSGQSLYTAARSWAECTAMLGGRAELLEAVKFFLSHHKYGPSFKSTRFVDAAKDYHAFKVKDGKSDSHCNNILRRFGRLAKALPSDVKLDELTAGQLDEAVLSLKLGKKTRNDYRDHLQNLFKWAAKQNPPLVPHGLNPATKMEHHEIGHTEVEFLRVYDLRKIIMALESKRSDLLPLIVLVCFGALRPSEAVRLEWTEVGENHIRLPGKKSKTGYSRQIPLQENLKSWLTLWRKSEGQVCSEISLPHVNAAIRNASGIRLPHDGMRHAYGSYRQALIKNVGAVAAEMGNSLDVCKRHYLNPFCDENEAAEWFSIVPPVPENIVKMPEAVSAAGQP